MPRGGGERGKQGPAKQQAQKPGLAAENTVCYLQVLGLGTDCGDAAPSVLLFFDRQRYLFNAGEGFQRFCVEHRVRMARISTCLLTRLTGDAAGGLPGMCLTMADAGWAAAAQKPALDLIGPAGLSALTDAAATFVSPTAVPLAPLEFGAEPAGAAGEEQPAASSSGQAVLPPVVQNDLLSITPVLLRPSAAAGAGGSGGEHPSKRPRLGGDGNSSCAAAAAGTAQGAPACPEQPPAACYVCELARVPGRFLPDKAAELGVPRGKLFAVLKGGASVTLEDGRVVEPHLVNEPSHPGPVAVVADCPDASYLPALLAAPVWQERCWQAGGQGADVVCHLAPAEVVALPEYRGWCERFGSGTRHIFVNAAAAGGAPVMASSALLQARLHAVQPTVFPLPHTDAPAAASGTGLPACAPGEQQPERFTAGCNLLKLHLRPPQRRGCLDAGEVPAAPDLQAAQQELRERPELAEALQAVAAFKADAAEPADAGPLGLLARLSRSSLELVLLGTGAAIPSKYRNVTGTFLDFSERGCMLADCGEGSWGQLLRRFGRGRAEACLQRLRCVWISHIHADHHVGLPRVLAHRRQLLGAGCPELLVIGPRPLRRTLAAHARLLPLACRFVECRQTAAGQPGLQAADRQAWQAAADALGLSRLESFPVEHCADAHGLLLQSTEGWKVVLSGDTRPCAAVEKAAEGALLLVHEATFDDALRGEALAKRHSTTGEAVACGARAGAFRTLLSHFSQRYPKVPVINESFAASTCIAFDLMSVNLQDLPLLPALVRPLSLLFPEEGAGQEGEAE